LAKAWKENATLRAAYDRLREAAMQVCTVLAGAERSGEVEDVPEGVRFVEFSDTLVRDLEFRLRAALARGGGEGVKTELTESKDGQRVVQAALAQVRNTATDDPNRFAIDADEVAKATGLPMEFVVRVLDDVFDDAIRQEE
jgi:hypothetical protein